MLLSSAIVSGIEIGHNLTGSSFYVDAAGNGDLQADTIEIRRVSSSLVEAVWHDTHSTPLQHSHHLIMTEGVHGLYGYDVMHAVRDTSISEVRMNVRWDRCILNNAFNYERGHDSKQPTYAYLYTQYKVQDETWRVDGVNNPTLACPADNEGGLPAGDVYTKYQWSLYHAENPFWGHYGGDAASNTGIGAWFTPLGGVSGSTSAANYGVGPNHQDLALHQDTIVLNYMGVNHYGEPGYSLKAGYVRTYGPWLTFLTVGAYDQPATLLQQAAETAASAIASSIPFLDLVDDSQYYAPLSSRSNVSGTIRVTDGRPASDLYVLLSTEAVEGIVDQVHEPAYWVKTGTNGSFLLPGVPYGSYSLYVWGAGGSITDQWRVDSLSITSPSTALGTLDWTPVGWNKTLLWQIGSADRFGGEYALGNHSRGWFLPGLIPGDLTFTIGSSHESSDWFYAQTQGGTWTVNFNLPQAVTGTAYLTISASMTQGNSPSVALNGDSSVFTGVCAPQGEDSTLSRQTVRSGYPRLATCTFDATKLAMGANSLTFTRPPGQGGSNNTGMGWDTVLLEVDTAAHGLQGHGSDVDGKCSHMGRPDVESQSALRLSNLRLELAPGMNGTYRLSATVQNRGSSTLYDVRSPAVLLTDRHGKGVGCREAVRVLPDGQVATEALLLRTLNKQGKDATRHPLPVAAYLLPGTRIELELFLALPLSQVRDPLEQNGTNRVAHLSVTVYADGGRVQAQEALVGSAAQTLSFSLAQVETSRCVDIVRQPHTARELALALATPR